MELGDKVLATDPETGETSPKLVTALITGEGTEALRKSDSTTQSPADLR